MTTKNLAPHLRPNTACPIKNLLGKRRIKAHSISSEAPGWRRFILTSPLSAINKFKKKKEELLYMESFRHAGWASHSSDESCKGDPTHTHFTGKETEARSAQETYTKSQNSISATKTFQSARQRRSLRFVLSCHGGPAPHALLK